MPFSWTTIRSLRFCWVLRNNFNECLDVEWVFFSHWRNKQTKEGKENINYLWNQEPIHIKISLCLIILLIFNWINLNQYNCLSINKSKILKSWINEVNFMDFFLVIWLPWSLKLFRSMDNGTIYHVSRQTLQILSLFVWLCLVNREKINKKIMTNCKNCWKSIKRTETFRTKALQIWKCCWKIVCWIRKTKYLVWYFDVCLNWRFIIEYIFASTMTLLIF